MRRAGKGYSSYRGRRTLTDVLKFVVAVLGVLALVLLVVLWFNGGQGIPALKLPTSQADSQGSAASTGDGSNAAGSDAQGGSDTSQGQEEPSQEEPQGEPATAALELPVSAVLDGTAELQLEQAGANALIVTMKDTEGMLSWASQQPLAQSIGANAADEEIANQLRAWNEGEIYTIARVCCFRDNTLPYYRNTMALRASYGNWRDELGLRWLNPASTEAQAYLAALCGELAAMGFDEILLECAAFPTAGQVERITTENTDLEQAVQSFLDQVKQALQPYGTVLSLRVESGTLTGALPACGLTAELLAGEDGRIWMEADGVSQPAALLVEAGVADGEQRLVELVPQLTGDVSHPQAQLAN